MAFPSMTCDMPAMLFFTIVIRSINFRRSTDPSCCLITMEPLTAPDPFWALSYLESFRGLSVSLAKAWMKQNSNSEALGVVQT